MQIAIQGSKIYLRELTPLEFRAIKDWGGVLRWNKEQGIYSGNATMNVLDRLAEMVRLPPAAETRRKALHQIQDAVDTERTAEAPAALTDYPVRVPMYSHQTRGANMALITFQWAFPGGDKPPEAPLPGHGFGFLFEMGCGKTLATIAVAGAGYQQGKIKRVLIVAPASVVAVWPKELQQYAAFPYSVQTMLGTKQQRLKALQALQDGAPEGLQIAVINYESIWRDGISDALEKYKPDLIVADESQRIKTHNAAQSKEMHRLGDRAPYKMILSGTPVQNQAVDLWSQYRFLDSGVFGMNYYTFRNRYCIMGGFNDHQIVGYRDMETLVRKEHSVAYRVTKEEALDLPEQTFEQRLVQLAPAERKLYNQIRRESFAELSTGGTVTATTVLTKMLRLQQITGGFVQEDDRNGPRRVNKAKLDALEEILQDYVIEGGKKLVIFARFIPEVNAISDLAYIALSKVQKKMVCLYGDVPQSARGDIVAQFQTDPDTMVFVGQIDTAGTGITLTAADTCVYYSLTFNYATYSQSLSRIHRIGQRNRCTYIHLLTEGTIDVTVLAALEAKEDLAKIVVDNWQQFFIQED